MSDRDEVRTTDAQRRGRSTRPAVLRALAIIGVLAAWLAIGGQGGQLFERLSEVQENDNASFLPSSAESARVSDALGGFFDDQSLPFFVVLERTGGLEPDDLAAAQALADGAPELALDVDLEEVGEGEEVQDVYLLGDYLVGDPTVVPSQDGEAVLVLLEVGSDQTAGNLPDGQTVVFAIAESLRAATGQLPEGVDAWVTGFGGILADFVTAFEGIDGTLLQVTLSVVFLILLLVYRSPLLPFAALLTAVIALSGAILVIYPLAKNGYIDLNGQSQGILFILVVGAATDYALLLVSRYREELHDHASKWEAMRRAWRAAAPAIVASAATVVLGLLCLLLSDLGSNRGLGPVGSIGVGFALVASLTLLPALLLVPVVLLVVLAAGVLAGLGAAVLGAPGAVVGAAIGVLVIAVLAWLRHDVLQKIADGAPYRTLPWYARPASGRWLFWPRVPRVDHVHVEDAGAQGAVWGRVANLVGRRPRAVWSTTLVGLLGLAAFLPTFDADGIKAVDLFREPVDSVVGQEALERHFPAGSGSPAQVIAPVDDVERVVEIASETDGVVGVLPYTRADGLVPPVPGEPPAEPVVVDGQVLLQVALVDAAESAEAEAVISELRDAFDEVSPDVLVGGLTASTLDVLDASERDLRVIIPSILLVIFVVLVVLLRSVVAPVVIIVANVISFAATIGAAGLVFTHLLDVPDIDPAVPLYGFVFLVALGVDYSIFLMTRVREESVARGTRPGILVGLTVTGRVITSAGIVLAATFSALTTVPIVFLLQIAFIVAFGVLLDTIVVRSLLVPALSYDIGRRVWWPSRLARERPEPSGRHATAAMVASPTAELADEPLGEPGPGGHRAD